MASEINVIANVEGLSDLIRNSALFHQIPRDDLNNKLAAQVLNNEAHKELFVQSELARINQTLRAKSARKKIHVHDAVTPAQQKILCEKNHMFDLDFSHALNSTGHPFHRAVRKLFETRSLWELGVNENTKPGKGYDVVVKDVGANATTHIGDIRFHSCTPILSPCDAKRQAKYEYALQKFEPDPQSKASYDLHVRGDSRVHCKRVSQSCHIKAPIMIYNHSIYDMKPEHAVASMAAANAFIGKGVLHFHPMVLYLEEGRFPNGLFFRKFRNPGGEVIKIRFYFENDNQRGYGHDYVNYLSLLSMFKLQHVTSETSTYIVEYEEQCDDDCVYFTITACREAYIPRASEFRVFTDESLKDKIIVYYWEWSTLNTGVFFNTLATKLSPIRLITPLKLYNLLYSYTVGLSDQKFTVKNIIKAGQAFNTREIISGQSVKVPDPISPEDLMHLCHAIFLLVYIRSFECSQALSALIKQENDVRRTSNSNFIYRFISNQLRKLSRHFNPTPQHAELFSALRKTETDEPCSQTNHYRRLFDCLKTTREFATYVDKKMRSILDDRRGNCGNHEQQR